MVHALLYDLVALGSSRCDLLSSPGFRALSLAAFDSPLSLFIWNLGFLRPPGRLSPLNCLGFRIPLSDIGPNAM